MFALIICCGVSDAGFVDFIVWFVLAQWLWICLPFSWHFDLFCCCFV